MSLTINSKTFTADSYKENAVTYLGPDKTLSSKDDFRIARTMPKPVPSNSGVGRVQFKLVRTHALTGAITESGDAIVTMDFGIPVGTSDADVDEIFADLASAFANASVKNAVKQLRVAY